MKKVSIIIATYNAVKTLHVALNSVQNQNFLDWECIIVDGASKDGTVEVVKYFSENDSRYRWVSEPDGGYIMLLTKGGEWLKGNGFII